MSAALILSEPSKTCCTCREAKPLTEFCRKARMSDGLNNQCKACTAKARRSYYDRNRERENAMAREWKRENIEGVKAYWQVWYAENREKQIAVASRWARENKEWRSERRRLKYATDEEHRQRVLESGRKSVARRQEKVRQTAAEYYQRNKEVIKARVRAWAKANPQRVGVYRSERRAAVLRAVPIWYDHRKVEEIYRQAREMGERDGIPYDVDHIVPLRSPIVCGLHWHGNLQVITAYENGSKQNRYWPDMP